MEGESQAAAAQRLYDQRGATYEDSWHPAFAKKFVDLAGIQSGQRVLDLACGTGLVSFLAAGHVGPDGKVIGIDISSGMLQVAQDRKSQGGGPYGRVDFYQHDIADLPSLAAVEEDSFDVITCASALVLLKDATAAVTQWLKYLKTGGKLVVDVPDTHNLIGGMVLERVGQRLNVPVPYNRSWVSNNDRLKGLLSDLGLQIEQYMLVEQSGAGVQYYDIDDADDHFVKHALTESGRALRAPDVRNEARSAYAEEWKKVAESGKVKEVDGVWVAVARKVKDAMTEPAKAVFTGGCRCGGVRYTSSDPPKPYNNCYCETCRRLSGGAYLPFLEVPTKAFKFVSDQSLTTFAVTDSAERTFCNRCGSPMSMKYHAQPDRFWITLGSVDEESMGNEHWPRLKAHIYVKEKPKWCTLPEDGVERCEEM